MTTMKTPDITTLADEARTLAGKLREAAACESYEDLRALAGPVANTLNMLAAYTNIAAYYSITPDGLEVHGSPKDAHDTALGWLEPDGGWHEDIEDVQWGMVLPIERARECDRTETPGGEFDYTCNYALAPVATAETVRALPSVKEALPVGLSLKAHAVPVGGLALDFNANNTPLIYHTRGMGVWLRDEEDRSLVDARDMWSWSDIPSGEADCVFLGYPSATPEALRKVIETAAKNPGVGTLLARAGLIK